MPTVVIADDELHLRLLVSATLAAADCRLVQAANGDEAWEAVQRERPQVAVLDVMMPGKTGIEVLQLIRADEQLANTKVILLTAKNQPGDADAGRKAGANLYLTKPFSPLTLLNAVTCDFVVEAPDRGFGTDGLHVSTAGRAGDQWHPALTVHIERPAEEPQPSSVSAMVRTKPKWPKEFIDEARLGELLGYRDTGEDSAPEAAASQRIARLQQRLVDASIKGKIRRYVVRDPVDGGVVAHGYRREDIKRLFDTIVPARAGA
jgi:CheY-like chemotaxis protein